MTTSAKKLELKAQKRELFGKKLKKLRHGGEVPANIFGPGFKSLSISVNEKEFNKAYKVAQETGIVYVQVDKEELPVLVKNVQIHPVTHAMLHIDLRKIDLKQKIETQVPFKLNGESPAVKQKGGVLLTLMNEVLIEALPQDIPHEIEIDVTKLDEIGKEIKISDLPKNASYEIKDEAEKVIVSVIAHKEESLTPETTAAAPEVITEKVAEGEEGAEGTAPAEEGKEGGEGKKPEGKEGKKEEGKQEKSAEGKKPEAKEGKKEEKK